MVAAMMLMLMTFNNDITAIIKSAYINIIARMHFSVATFNTVSQGFYNSIDPLYVMTIGLNPP